jgi:hypothetical protein
LFLEICYLNKYRTIFHSICQVKFRKFVKNSLEISGGMDAACYSEFGTKKLRITFRLFTTLPAPYKAMRSIAGAGNVPE